MLQLCLVDQIGPAGLIQHDSDDYNRPVLHAFDKRGRIKFIHHDSGDYSNLEFHAKVDGGLSSLTNMDTSYQITTLVGETLPTHCGGKVR